MTNFESGRENQLIPQSLPRPVIPFPLPSTGRGLGRLPAKQQQPQALAANTRGAKSTVGTATVESHQGGTHGGVLKDEPLKGGMYFMLLGVTAPK